MEWLESYNNSSHKQEEQKIEIDNVNDRKNEQNNQESADKSEETIAMSYIESLKSNKNTKSKIIYTSRTHSQLSQVMGELKNTPYQPKTVIIASRDHM